jgi:hypothetical protein
MMRQQPIGLSVEKFKALTRQTYILQLASQFAVAQCNVEVLAGEETKAEEQSCKYYDVGNIGPQ